MSQKQVKTIVYTILDCCRVRTYRNSPSTLLRLAAGFNVLTSSRVAPSFPYPRHDLQTTPLQPIQPLSPHWIFSQICKEGLVDRLIPLLRIQNQIPRILRLMNYFLQRNPFESSETLGSPSLASTGMRRDSSRLSMSGISTLNPTSSNSSR